MAEPRMLMMMMMMMMIGVKLLALLPLLSGALGDAEVRKVAARNNVTCILVFRDSSVDPGNNNVLHTTMKGNFLPYGKDYFFHGCLTGRFSNGRLATDFIAEAVGYRRTIPAFLDPNLKPADLLHGVIFASISCMLRVMMNSLLAFRQLKSFMHYKLNLTRLVGKKTAEYTIKNAIFIMSIATNDFIQNYYLEPTRRPILIRVATMHHELTSLEGFSCLQKGSEFQPLVTADSLDPQSAVEFNPSSSYEEKDGVSLVVPSLPRRSKNRFLL